MPVNKVPAVQIVKKIVNVKITSYCKALARFFRSTKTTHQQITNTYAWTDRGGTNNFD
jgi:hypothetical protein